MGSLLQGAVGFIPSWDGPAWMTSTDYDMWSLKKAIVIYFISIFEINERTR
jgi:hypothetical protein